MKKVLSFLLAVCTCLTGLVSCQSNENAERNHENVITDEAETQCSHENVITDEAETQCSHENVITDEEVTPTYTQTGLTKGIHCANCGYVIEPQETIPCLNDQVYNNAQKTYLLLSESASLIIAGMDDVYNAWIFEIYDADDCTENNVLLKLSDKVSFSRKEINRAFTKYCEAVGMAGNEDLVLQSAIGWVFDDIPVFDVCPEIIRKAFEIRGDYDIIDSKITEAKTLLKEFTVKYSDYSNYPDLKQYYSQVSSYAEYFKKSTDSYFEPDLKTINDYENSIRTIQSSLGFVFD